MKKYDVVIAGYLCVDLIPGFKSENAVSTISDLLAPGKLIEIERLNFIPGGAVANTSLALKKFNKKVFLNRLIGDNFIGQVVREWFGNYSL